MPVTPVIRTSDARRQAADPLVQQIQSGPLVTVLEPDADAGERPAPRGPAVTRWARGEAEVEQLLGRRELEAVTGAAADGAPLLAQARRTHFLRIAERHEFKPRLLPPRPFFERSRILKVSSERPLAAMRAPVGDDGQYAVGDYSCDLTGSAGSCVDFADGPAEASQPGGRVFVELRLGP